MSKDALYATGYWTIQIECPLCGKIFQADSPRMPKGRRVCRLTLKCQGQLCDGEGAGCGVKTEYKLKGERVWIPTEAIPVAKKQSNAAETREGKRDE